MTIQHSKNKRFLDCNHRGKISLSRKNHRYTRWITQLSDKDPEWVILQNEATDLVLEGQNSRVFASVVKENSDTQKWKMSGLNLINKANGLALTVRKSFFSTKIILKDLDEDNVWQQWAMLGKDE